MWSYREKLDWMYFEVHIPLNTWESRSIKDPPSITFRFNNSFNMNSYLLLLISQKVNFFVLMISIILFMYMNNKQANGQREGQVPSSLT